MVYQFETKIMHGRQTSISVLFLSPSLIYDNNQTFFFTRF